MSALANVFGILGNIVAIMLFASPAPTFWKIIKARTVGDFSPVPYVCTFCNCGLWLFYGSPFIVNTVLIMTVNGTGAILALIFTVIYFLFARGGSLKRVSLYFGLVVLFLAAIILGNLLGTKDKKVRQTIVGIICVVVNIIMYVAPLSVMKMVITTKSTEFMPLPLSMMNVISGSVWTLYGIIVMDIYIIIPNGSGVVLGLIQLGLYFTYCGNTKKMKKQKAAQANGVVV